MKGLQLAEEYFKEYGMEMLEKEFSEYMPRIAAGLVGHGSECFGYDDEVSTDHDFEPRFFIWLTDDDEKEFGFKLFRAYDRLPREFKGISVKGKSSFGSDFKGVKTIREFYSFYTRTGDVPLTNADWLSIPDIYLAEATNGEVFLDNLGEFSRIRRALKNDRPEDVRLKKLSSAVFNMAQSGQYNYDRAIRHGQYSAAALALAEFCKYTAFAVYLINKEYAPYYKWLFRGMSDLGVLSELKDDIDELLKCPYGVQKNDVLIEKIAANVGAELRSCGLANTTDNYLEPYAYQIADRIKDASLRNAPVML